VALAFVYVLISQLVLSMGYAGSLHPLLAAWATNVFFAVMSMLLFVLSMH